MLVRIFKLFLILLNLVFLRTSIQCQDTINQLDHMDRKQGLWYDTIVMLTRKSQLDDKLKNYKLIDI